MKNITDKLFIYLEAKRHIWNTYFVNVFESLRECSPLDEYEKIDSLLFSALVLKDLRKPSLLFDKDFLFGTMPFSYLKVIPNEGLEKLGVIISNPASSSSHQWEHIDLEIDTHTEFSFIEFFEWYRYGYVTYPYFRVRITKYDKKPDIVNWDALIETINAKVFFID